MEFDRPFSGFPPRLEQRYASAIPEALRYPECRQAHMPTKPVTKSPAGLNALKALQTAAAKKGLDRLSPEAIEGEIVDHRRDSSPKRNDAPRRGK